MVANINGNVVNVIMADDMPISETEFVKKNNDDSFTIMLNAKYDQATLQDAFKHALTHIENNDWDRGDETDLQQIEAEAHGLCARQEKPLEPEQKPQDPLIPDWLLRLLVDACVQAYLLGASSRPAGRRSRYSSDYWELSEDDAMRLDEAYWLYEE